MNIHRWFFVGVAISMPWLLAAQAQKARPKPLIEELVAANHILANIGVLDAYGHVSVRDDRNPNHFLLARHMAAGLVTADDIIEYDFDSKAVNAAEATGYTERFIHGNIYKARPDVMSVVHFHAPEVIPFGVSNIPLRRREAQCGRPVDPRRSHRQAARRGIPSRGPG